jgi:hypothetical protein
VDPRNAIPNHLGRWNLVLLVVRIIGTVLVHGMTFWKTPPTGPFQLDADALSQRVGGVGVKNSNPDRPDALISGPNRLFFSLSQVFARPLRNVSSGAEVHASGDAPFRSTKRGAPFWGGAHEKMRACFPARSR